MRRAPYHRHAGRVVVADAILVVVLDQCHQRRRGVLAPAALDQDLTEQEAQRSRFRVTFARLEHRLGAIERAASSERLCLNQNGSQRELRVVRGRRLRRLLGVGVAPSGELDLREYELGRAALSRGDRLAQSLLGLRVAAEAKGVLAERELTLRWHLFRWFGARRGMCGRRGSGAATLEEQEPGEGVCGKARAPHDERTFQDDALARASGRVDRARSRRGHRSRAVRRSRGNRWPRPEASAYVAPQRRR